MANNEYEFLKKSINDYLAEENVDYVLLLSGKWGTGKTYLINEIVTPQGAQVDKSTSNKVWKMLKSLVFSIGDMFRFILLDLIFQLLFILLSFFWEGFLGCFKIIERLFYFSKVSARYISLNGVSSVETLNTLLFLSINSRHPEKRLHFIKSFYVALSHIPILSTITNVYMQIITSSHYMGDQCPIIFDDVERCGLSGGELFGFLKKFQDEFKVPIVLVGDEEKLPGALGISSEIYSEIKEKLIGRTLVKHANIEDIINQFVLRLELQQEAFPDVIEMCISLFKMFRDYKDESGRVYENLRAFKISIAEIGRCLDNLEPRFRENNEFLVRFLKIGIALKYAVQVGRFTKENWDENIEEDGKGQFPTTIVEQFLKTLNETSFEFASMYPILSLDMWKNILFGEVLDWGEINTFIGQNCEQFKKDMVKSYEKFIHFDVMKKEDIEECLKQLEKEIRNKEIVAMVEIFRVYSVKASLLSAHECVYSDTSKNERVQLRTELEQYVNGLLKEDKLQIDEDDLQMIGPRFGRSPLVKIVENPQQFFTDVLQQSVAKYNVNKQERMVTFLKEGKIQQFVDVLTEDFQGKVLFTRDGVITPASFIELLTKLEPNELHAILQAFEDRYHFNVVNWNEYFKWCIPEKEALLEMVRLLNVEVDKVKGEDCYQAYRYIQFINDIEKVLHRINEVSLSND